MPHIDINRRKPATAVLILLLAGLLLAACGSSSSSSTTNASASATSAPGAGPTGPGGGRFQALRECLQKNGITLPKRTPGTGRPPGGGGFLGGGARALPTGVTRAQYEAALKKCGGTGFAGPGRSLNSQARVQALTLFAACMRQNGVNLPPPNTSGNGPVFDTKGLNRTSSQFTTAEAKCRNDLQGAFPGRAGGATGSSGVAG